MRMPTTTSDPSGLFAAVGGLVAAILAVVAIFVPLPPGLTEAILGLIAAAAPVAAALGIRRHAYAPATVHRVRMMAGEGGSNAGRYTTTHHPLGDSDAEGSDRSRPRREDVGDA